MKDSQLDLGMSGGELPRWFHVAKDTPKEQVRNVTMGRHPMGPELGDGAHTCSSCAHATVNEWYPKRYFKCQLFSNNTSLRGGDIRLGWRCCERWAKLGS
jgi:hypothetical protein